MKKRHEKSNYLYLRFLVLIVLVSLVGFYIFQNQKNKEENSWNEEGSLYSLSVNGNPYLVSSYSPFSVYLGDKFMIKCNYGAALPCITAEHVGEACSFTGFNRTAAVFICDAKKLGDQENFCSLFYYENDSRCLVPRKDRIAGTRIIEKTESISNTENECVPDWACDDWSNCINNQKTRICNDNNNCNTDKDKPVEREFCAENCIASCLGKECGDDGCGGECGVCNNLCYDNKCVTNTNTGIKQNTLVFAGIYPATWNAGEITKNYVNVLSSNINGLATCCSVQTTVTGLVEAYHSKGFLVMTHVGTKEEALQAAEDRIDIIIFDEVKLMSGKNGRPAAFSGNEFNLIKSEIKKINPNAKVGIVEAYIEDYVQWKNEGAEPEIIGLEQYITRDGDSAEGYPSYNEFLGEVASRFPNSNIQIWINDVQQIDWFIGKVYSIVLFGVDSYKLGSFGSDWPYFRLEDIENNLRVQNGQAQLVSSSAPAIASNGNVFEIRCDFGAQIPCIIAIHGDKKCNYVKFEGTTGVFNCIADKLGVINNYCNLFALESDKRCFNQENKIQSTEVKVCTPSCAGKTCGSNGCGGSCGVCQGNQNCEYGKCVEHCNIFQRICGWFKLCEC